MKKIIRYGAWIALALSSSVSVASADFTGSSGDHGSYLEELFEWPPHLRQLHYYAEVGGGLIILGFIIVGVIERIKNPKNESKRNQIVETRKSIANREPDKK